MITCLATVMCASQPKCPQSDACPGNCAKGHDSNGCETCTCSNTEDGTLLTKNLKEACTTTADCSAAFSTCKSKTCQCLKGFKEKDGKCTSPTLQCPTWSGQSSSKAGKACTVTVDYSVEDAEANHTCDHKKEFCYTHPNVKDFEGRLVGHCCTKPPKGQKSVKLVCPYDITDNGTCPDTSQIPADAPAPEHLIRTCSYTASDCVHRFGGRVCCPIPCHGASSHFAVEGKCYDYALIDGLCDVDAQCGGGSFCKHQGSGHPICACKGKTVQEPSPHCAT